MARMGAAHLASQGGGYEPQRKHNFELQLYGVPGPEVIKLSVQSFTPPGATNEPISVPYLNQVIKVAGQGNWDNADIVVRDMVDAPTWASIMAWKKMVHDPDNDNIGFASQYKKQGELVVFAPDGTVERKYKMIGLWPTTVKGEALDHQSSDIWRINVTLSVDKAIPMF